MCVCCVEYEDAVGVCSVSVVCVCLCYVWDTSMEGLLVPHPDLDTSMYKSCTQSEEHSLNSPDPNSIWFSKFSAFFDFPQGLKGVGSPTLPNRLAYILLPRDPRQQQHNPRRPL